MNPAKKSPGRPRTPDDEKRAKTGVSLSKQAEREGRECAKHMGMSFSAFVEMAMRQELERRNANKIVTMPTTPAAPSVKEHWIDLCGGVAAGSQISTDCPSEPIAVSKPYDDDCYALRVFGESMEPKIPDGAIIIVQRIPDGECPKQGSIVVYSDGYGKSLKQLGYRKAKADEAANAFGKVAVLKSINPKFPEIQTMDGGKIESVFVESL